MHYLCWMPVVINIGLLLLVCEIPGYHVSAKKTINVIKNTERDKSLSFIATDEAKIVPISSQDEDTSSKDTVSYSATKRSNKRCKCLCLYPNNKNEIKQCAIPTIPTIPTPPTPSSGNSSGFDIRIPPLQVNGIFPSLTLTADSGPSRSECGTGALMPWANKLYVVSYLSVPDGGSGTGLYAVDENFTMTRLASHNSTYANRILHKETNQIIIGAWIIDMEGNHRAFTDLLNVRVAATAEHLTEPATKVYMLGMDGPLWECNVVTLECTQLFNLVEELSIPSAEGEQPHFKAAHTMNGRLVVASNTFEEQDFTGDQHGGRLAEWEGPGHNWTILEKTAFVEVTGRRNFGQVIYALGWDYRSVILKVFDGDNPKYRNWQTYRLPKGSHAYDHLWQTEWPRIREVETERYLMDMHGIFYELSPLGWAGSTWGVKPISQHLRMVPDFTSYRGFLVLGGNQVSSIFDNNVVTGQAQSGLWFGKTDDLWSFGKPQGWGAVWRADDVANGTVSDPYLMTGFDKKVLHLILHDDSSAQVNIEVDVTGSAGHRAYENWVGLERFYLKQSRPYAYFVFPSGYSVHWVRTRLITDHTSCKITAYFVYT